MVLRLRLRRAIYIADIDFDSLERGLKCHSYTSRGHGCGIFKLLIFVDSCVAETVA